MPFAEALCLVVALDKAHSRKRGTRYIFVSVKETYARVPSPGARRVKAWPRMAFAEALCLVVALD